MLKNMQYSDTEQSSVCKKSGADFLSAHDLEITHWKC